MHAILLVSTAVEPAPATGCGRRMDGLASTTDTTDDVEWAFKYATAMHTKGACGEQWLVLACTPMWPPFAHWYLYLVTSPTRLPSCDQPRLLCSLTTSASLQVVFA
jgi:hypothetical protein